MTNLYESSSIDLPNAYDEDFAREVLDGLAASPRTLPASLFYDDEGARLFDEITELPEYYATRTEQRILEEIVPELSESLGSDLELAEFGAGSSQKTEVLLRGLDVRRYIPIDVSDWYLESSAKRIRSRFPDLDVRPLHADYGQDVDIPWSPDRPRVAFFPGSTIGNFHHGEAIRFLQRARRALGPKGALVLGVDLRKDPRVLHAAYNDSAGVTAAFNRNILEHVNAVLDADFEVDRWIHHALFDPKESRIEMHLVADSAQTVRVAGRVFEFDAFESIWTESSYKYSERALRQLAHEGGFERDAFWTDPERLFSVSLLRAAR